VSIEKAEFLQQSMLQLPTSDSVPTERKASTTLSTKAEEIIITVEEEKQPLLAVDDPIITINTVGLRNITGIQLCSLVT
jgi:transcriptional antiterminator Rof (Rho-off)